MNEANQLPATNNLLADMPSEPSPPAPEPYPTVTLADRCKLVDELVAEAVSQPDPMARNIGMFAADLCLTQHCVNLRLRPQMLAAAAAGGPAIPELKEAIANNREVDRFAKHYGRLRQQNKK